VPSRNFGLSEKIGTHQAALNSVLRQAAEYFRFFFGRNQVYSKEGLDETILNPAGKANQARFCSK